ncbi:hypothetical protein CUZ96_1968 [Enterococcus lactis]|uniref:Uncharacterized protein n=1 Tax=Enterococcus faecium 505 TaxID=1134806 RepID=J7CT35_ENTFC|nr:hypothetical protein HMPREF1348_02423 [Enterococcus faecium 505]MBL5006296.1 hypothetical protein [Enterococcus lactis]MBL5012302.1 hypothetical protein [Enterococcus lactis]
MKKIFLPLLKVSSSLYRLFVSFYHYDRRLNNTFCIFLSTTG